MYKISVPIISSRVDRSNREKLLNEIKRLNAERVFLVLVTYELEPDKRKVALKEFEENCKYFKNQGFEVGAWFWTFMLENNTQFRNMRSIQGTEIKNFMCPTDENFVKFATDYISDIAKCGVSLIMFDDDFRYGHLAESPACLCDRHIEMINEITGENSTREELKEYILSGKKNKFRDAYLKANGDAFRSFAASVRAAVDKVNPEVRVGACACITSWDVDGTDAYELAKILAGNTQPFVRLIGAPYWARRQSWGNALQDVIEVERLECTWTRHDDIEIFSEGDVFPRPRYYCPASYLEGFDTALRASGCTDGILKYGLDYTSIADYEKGYAAFHERNRELYKAIDESFGNKNHCGVRVYESMKKLADMDFTKKVKQQTQIQNILFSKAARMLAHNCIPTVYEGEGVCGIVFEENARNLPLSALKKGLILDIAAAEILTERGIDVGLVEVGDRLFAAKEEHFRYNDNYIAINNIDAGASVYDITLKEGAEVLSDTLVSDKLYPLSYKYENADGNRFLVININVAVDDSTALRQYERGRQVADNIAWLSGEKLPAYVYGHPSLYMQCKEDKDSMAVGIWNFFADTAIEPVVQLGESYDSIKFINCDGRLENDKVYLNDINPFAFAGFEVFKNQK